MWDRDRGIWDVGERSLKLIWSQNHNIYNYVFIYIYIYDSGIKITGGHTVDIKVNWSVPPN